MYQLLEVYVSFTQFFFQMSNRWEKQPAKM